VKYVKVCAVPEVLCENMLKCVQFQFLMDTILNLVIIQFFMKKKGDAPTKHAPSGPDARSITWSTSCLTSLKYLDCRGFKSW
jgi:hypothetical protein